QEVEASSPGLSANATFTAAALPGPPVLIVVDSGDQQVGVAGQALPRPLVAAVTDAGFNRRSGIAVQFTVAAGVGHFANGLQQLTVNTDSDGRAIVPFVLDPAEGVAGNTVVATVEGLDNGPAAAFTATGLAAGDPAATSISGIVLDNSNLPVEGVTLRILNSVLTAHSDAQGRFHLAGAPVGSVTLIVDGSTANRPGSWPDLEFVLSTVPGRDNTVNMPIFLLPIDLAHGVAVDETHGGILTPPGLPGFSLEIAPGSVTFPGGSRSGVVSVTAVHSDKVPMVPNFGQQPRFIVTIQPPGARFDPPARMTMPNVDGLAPGTVTELYSFDHDLGHFVSIGPATVSDDGRVVTSNAGVGIVKGGWHCGGNPSGSGTAHSCPDCQRCVNSCCQPDPGQQGHSCDDHDECTADDKCTGGSCHGTKIHVTITKAPTVVCVDGDKPAAATIEPSDRPIFWRALNPNFSVAGADTTATVHGVSRGTGTLVAQDAQTDCSKDSRAIQVITKDKDFNGFGEKTMCVLGSLGGEQINAEIAAACFRARRLALAVQAWERTAFKPECQGEGSPSDAGRHGRWSCELYSDPLTKDFAEEILRRHENRPDDDCISHEQDLNNNEVGRSNAAAGKDCTASALQDLASGRLQVNNPPAGVTCP
ncbi:MAG: carboxypeptidase regulatory-like domain-containing protein, partial [Thermoanaerobaculia bacterium]